MKKILAMVLALCMMLSGMTFVSADEAPVELSWWLATPGFQVDDGRQDTPVTKALEAATNTVLDIYGNSDATLLASLMATGDLPDIMNVTVEDYNNLMAAGFLVPLDDLLAGAENINMWTDMLNSAKKRFTGEDGKLYAIEGYLSDPTSNKQGGYPYGFTIRWDFYREMGYPEVKTADDYLNVLADMLAKYPTNENGDKRYAMSMFSDWGWMTFFEVLAANIAALEGMPLCAIHGNVSTNGGWMDYNLETETVSNIIANEESILWRAVDFLNKAYKMGLMDPDSWTNTYDAVNTKATADRLLSDIWDWNMGAINTALYAEESEEGAGTGKGFRQLLSTSGQKYVFYGQRQNGITGFSQRVVCITTSCKNPEAAMKFLDYLYSYEGGRLLSAGVEGEHYVKTEEGKLMVPASVLDAKKADAEWSKKAGMAIYGNSVGISGGIVDPAYGQKVGLGDDSDKEYVSPYSQLVRDWCDYYGFEYTYDFGYKFIDMNGTIRSDYVANLAVMPDEIAEIDADINDYLGVELSQMVRIEDEAEFAAKKAEIIAECNELGLEESDAWHQQQWADSIAACNE